MKQGADECGWRKFPTAGTIRYNNVNPEFYAQADIAEVVADKLWRNSLLAMYMEHRELTVLGPDGISADWLK